MQICEYYRNNTQNEIECFEGRWHWEIQRSKATNDTFWTSFEWVDLFGKEETVTFTSTQPHQNVQELIPLNRKFGLVLISVPNNAHKSFRVIEFDWKRREFHLSNDNFDERRDFLGHKVIPDRKCPFTTDGNLNFMFYSTISDMYQHCNLDTANRKIILNGARFRLAEPEFNCVDLNGDIVSGLSGSLDAINRFDLKTRRFLDKIYIFGLPQTVKCIWNDVYRRDGGCWTSYNQFFVWSEETEIVDKEEHIYFKLHCVNLQTGIAVPLSHKFKLKIRHICQNPEDGNLYVKTGHYLRNVTYSERSELVEATNEDIMYSLHKCHSYRIPLNKPEPLPLIAFKYAPKPLPEIVKKLALMRKDLPLNIYKCE